VLNVISPKQIFTTVCSFPITIQQPNPLLSLTPSLGGFLRKTRAELEEEAGKCSLRHRCCHHVYDGKTNSPVDPSLAVLLTVLFLVIRAVVGILFVLKQGINISAIMTVRARANDPVYRDAENQQSREKYARRKAAKAAESATRVPTRVEAISDQNKAGHGAVSFGILGAIAWRSLHRCCANCWHTGVAINDLSGGRDGGHR
jgi:hypothetical protein